MTLLARSLSVVRDGQEIVRDVSVRVEPGEIVGLFGPSGAGKSTFFEALVGEVVPNKGTIHFNETEVTRLPLPAKFHLQWLYLPQTPALFLSATVEKNLGFFREAANKSAARTGTDILRESVPSDGEILERLGLAHRHGVRARDLSAGEKRKLEFARALLQKLQVIVCDEPFGGVDPQGVQLLSEFLVKFAKGGARVLLSDHHVAETLSICNAASLLVDGRSVLSLPASEFRAHEWVKGRYLSSE